MLANRFLRCVVLLGASLSLAACSDDDSPAPAHEGGTGGMPTSPMTDAAAGGAKNTAGASSGGRTNDGSVEHDASCRTCDAPDAEISLDSGATDSGAEPTDATSDGAPAPTTCAQIGEACRKVDPGTGPVHDCTVLQDSPDVSACDAQREHCRSLCGASLCVKLGSICHDPDPGSGPIHDCHTLGHANDAAGCFDRAPHCYEICQNAM